MTYRNKLLLKRTLIILGIVLAVLALAAVIGFTYLGRYVVYTEDGAYFSFRSQPPQTQSEQVNQFTPEQVNLVIGPSISAEEMMGNDDNNIPDSDVNGVLVDYETLKAGITLSALEVDLDVCNTLVLEMRKEGSEILSTDSVRTLIDRAKSRDLRLIALMSCLDDSEYALDHQDDALAISGGALWANSDGNYYLDPTKDSNIDYVAGLIHQLAEMGFQEVILDKFALPNSDSIIYDAGDSSRDALLVEAFHDLLDATASDCDIGLLISDPDEGHQALEAADRLYVYFSEGSRVRSYAEAHPDQYLVFITTSHDTRFENYGKLFAESQRWDTETAATAEEPVETVPEEDQFTDDMFE